jgi:hypothetical protein
MHELNKGSDSTSGVAQWKVVWRQVLHCTSCHPPFASCCSSEPQQLGAQQLTYWPQGRPLPWRRPIHKELQLELGWTRRVVPPVLWRLSFVRRQTGRVASTAPTFCSGVLRGSIRGSSVRSICEWPRLPVPEPFVLCVPWIVSVILVSNSAGVLVPEQFLHLWPCSNGLSILPTCLPFGEF